MCVQFAVDFTDPKIRIKNKKR